ncbi:PIN domain-containing protein, partial [Candidatus Woesearchaeota archaeon]|nr:PIN domain-containing protein [Candidatus Woesearchaeota archaeon]
MALKVYCDTNIFIDYLDEREDNIRPLQEFAFIFFSRGWNCAFKLIISDWLLDELRRHLTEEQINRVLNNFKEKDKLIFIKEALGDRQKARNISKHWDDALHAILANKANADYLATRNLKHYENCHNLVN